MFVAVDEKNKAVFGPFTSEGKAKAWILAFIEKVEGVDPNDARQIDGLILVNRLWNIHEVEFVDEDVFTFNVQPGCPCCRGNWNDPEHYHTLSCYPPHTLA